MLPVPSPTSTSTLGTLLRGVRDREGWTLKQTSEKSGIPISTLSKVEHDRLTLTYDKLQQLSRRLGMRMSKLFAETGHGAAQPVTARCSLSALAQSVHVEKPNYHYSYLCTELRRKRMVPVVAKIRAKTLEQFGDFVRHAGEEYLYVVRGRIVVHTEFHDPVVFDVGQSMYIDSTVGHAYLVANGCDEAEIIGVMSSADEELMQALMGIHHEQNGGEASSRAPAAQDGQPKPNTVRHALSAERGCRRAAAAGA